MYHNKKLLHKYARWLKFLSWLTLGWLGFTIFWIALSGSPIDLIQSSITDYTELGLPKWAGIVIFGGDMISPFLLWLVYFLIFQGTAAAIQYLLAFIEKMNIGE